jgi:hypothetical protein
METTVCSLPRDYVGQPAGPRPPCRGPAEGIPALSEDAGGHDFRERTVGGS